ncbi:protein kinase [Cellulosilyticum sp. ST5]|uniref:protein kinase domain-containing protein n=1 Tax=Cellulosilyticum sp. ST5 TaxID=3055805 RepID=UPI003977ADAE
MEGILSNLLEYLDGHFWDYKQSSTNFTYMGLILDYYFEDSVLNIDYLSINDYFTEHKLMYSENKRLAEQIEGILKENQLMFIQCILNILKVTHRNREEAKMILDKSIHYLQRNNVHVNNVSNDIIELSLDNTLGKGSYCIVSKYTEGIVKKELLPHNKSDEKLRKRLRYEYENTKKLCGCPNIITVYELTEDENSYLLQEAEMDLYDYLSSQISLSKKIRLKIIDDILQGIKFAHDNNIIHRDLHLGNILKIGNTFVISDFGWSKDISIVRSLKSSATEKNNHIFMDPLAAGDLTKMDFQTDIYSLGKIIEFVYNYFDKQDETMNLIVTKCTTRDKRNRYRCVDEIIEEIHLILMEIDEQEVKKQIDVNLKESILTSRELNYIKKLLANNELCNYIVKHKLSDFGKVILKIPELERVRVLNNINENYATSTGYGGFANYDIYGDISYYIYEHSENTNIKHISKEILEGCASYRFHSNSLLELINKKIM